MEQRVVSPDDLVARDDWSDLSLIRPMPIIDRDRLHAYRSGRLRAELEAAGAAMVVLFNPLSLRYAIDYRTYGLFQSRVPNTYLFFPLDGPLIMHGAYGVPEHCTESRTGRATNVFDGGPDLAEEARLFADDVVRYLAEIGCDNRRVAIEMVNPSITQALLQRGIEVIDGMAIAEMARVIKNEDEIECIRWAVAVAEHGIAKVHEAMRPGVSEQQLWGLLNYANLANDGDWHDGRMLCSGPRTNPWLQEASPRRIEAGDLVAFDTDMVGPMGYFADISRTFFCGPGQPTKRQKELYRLAVAEVEYNKTLMRPGARFADIQAQAFDVPEEFHEQAYPCLAHAVGMCDEYPRINYRFRGPQPYDGELAAGMVICVESYMGAVGERDGVKYEEQVLITEDGCEQLSTFPLDAALLD
ncbi:MAG: Xaa-Pro peptidase family protein [Pseudomonadota bacterium]